MADTANLKLPLLAQSQAQKFITVNAALERLDLLAMLAVKSRTLAAPPTDAADGDRYVVPAGAGGAWTGRATNVAVFLNGGWEFIEPREGWRAYVSDEGAEIVFNLGVWSPLTAPVSGGGGALSELDFEHAVTPGAAQDTAASIPAGSLVFGVTARVLETVEGPASWGIGVAGAESRYGAGLSTVVGATGGGVRGAPLAYPSAQTVRVAPEGGGFTAGRIRLRLHYLTLTPPA